MLDKPRDYGVDTTKQPLYQPVFECKYWPVLGSFDNWNIVQFTNKTTSSEEFDELHKVVIDGISETMASLVQLGNSSAINETDPTIIGYYMIK